MKRKDPYVRRFELPLAPSQQSGRVKAWSEAVVIPTYLPMPADKNPMFLERRVYQGSSGKVYPLPFIDRIATEAGDHSWEAVHLENEFLRVMVLPEIGGRIHVGMDKTNGYDFFYRQNVIKPALVGLAGPWISGGVEFNWPQHHRPATFMPVNVHIEQEEDGSQTIWCSDHDPMNRLKGMHGVCLHPGKAYIELKVRLYNRTPFVQTFLWWANVATHAHEVYQSFFAPDVQYVADHAKRAISNFPLCNGGYYGVNYGQRARDGVPADERPEQFIPPGTYAANDLAWYANIPVPTSYMALGSKEDFAGGYDHKRQAGLIHVADHHIAPGKKQWTWGNHDFGYAWDRNLTDEDGPYVELMAGVYTDNQPDFSFLAPGETRSFSQYWYPIRKIGPAKKANLNAAASLDVSEGQARIGICVTQRFSGAKVTLSTAAGDIREWVCDLVPEGVFLEAAPLSPGTTEFELTLLVLANSGRELLRYCPAIAQKQDAPAPATAPLTPQDIESNDELYLTGLHLEQYRHATRHAEDYWREALRRTPDDARCNNAMGLWHLRRGEFGQAESHFQTTIRTLTKRNPNPYDGEAYYNLGLTLRYLGRDADAYSAFYKATWNFAWRAPAYHALAELDAQRQNWDQAFEHVSRSLRTNTDNLNARNLAVCLLRKLDRHPEADRRLHQTLALDPLDIWAQYLSRGALPPDNQSCLDLAFDYARAGLVEEATEILQRADRQSHDGSVPLVFYALGRLHSQLGRTPEAAAARSEAAQASPDYCFPSRLEELLILQDAIMANPDDARAAYYLGNLLYDRRRHQQAIALWERSARLDPSFSVVWRNLGIGYFNVLGDAVRARSAFDAALRAKPDDARILYERDQLWKRVGEHPERRLAELESYPELVRLRDDLCIELASLYNRTRQYGKAQRLLQERKFQPWEGGEGLVLNQHVRTHLALGRRALAAGNPSEARRLFEQALACPDNLGEARHLLANKSGIYYLLGLAHEALGETKSAREYWQGAAHQQGDFQQMRVKEFSEMTYYQALALKHLGEVQEAEELFKAILGYSETLFQEAAKIDYFATSLPAMLLFEDDLQKRNTVTSIFLQAQAWLGLSDVCRAQRLLNQVLQLDRSHDLAADLLAEVESRPSIVHA
jgi:tetratricopeptide (TPR) repeat protein